MTQNKTATPATDAAATHKTLSYYSSIFDPKWMEVMPFEILQAKNTEFGWRGRHTPIIYNARTLKRVLKKAGGTGELPDLGGAK